MARTRKSSPNFGPREINRVLKSVMESANDHRVCKRREESTEAVCAAIVVASATKLSIRLYDLGGKVDLILGDADKEMEFNRKAVNKFSGLIRMLQHFFILVNDECDIVLMLSTKYSRKVKHHLDNIKNAINTSTKALLDGKKLCEDKKVIDLEGKIKYILKNELPQLLEDLPDEITGVMDELKQLEEDSKDIWQFCINEIKKDRVCVA